MKRIIPILIISISFCACEHEASTQTIYEVEPINMQGLRTKKGSVETLRILRNSIDDRTIVLFPSGGTETEVVLYHLAEYESRKSEQMGKRPKILRSDHETVNDSIEDGLRIDLTNLPDGNYVGEWVTCHVGGYTEIELKTKK